jgi:vacuolar-type H+-ATPase subunit E/Vma4
MKEEQETGKEKIIKGITRDAQEEAQKIREEAERVAEERREAAERQVASIRKEAEEKCAEQQKRIEQETESAIATETRRILLKSREHIMKSVIREAQKKLEAMIETEEYRDILLNWIAEAAVGLQAKEAEVSSSRKETHLIDSEILKQAQEKVETITGKTVTLEKSSDDPLQAQGVVLTAADGRTAFNNQVPTRIKRLQSEIRNLIYKELFENEVKT